MYCHLLLLLLCVHEGDREMGVNLLTSKKKARAAASSGEEIISLSMLMS
jgi:hypothetical protein